MDNLFCSIWKLMFAKRKEFISYAKSIGKEPDRYESELRIKEIEKKLKELETTVEEELEFEREMKRTIQEIEYGKRQEG